MKNLEQEIIDFHFQQGKIAKESNILLNMERAIIKKYCPFKKGDRVIYKEGWRMDGKKYFGVVKRITFNGVTENAIDTRWVICVERTTKDFNPHKCLRNDSRKYLGLNKKDLIIKV